MVFHFSCYLEPFLNLSHLWVFGCPAYVHIDAQQHRKLADKAWKGIFVGYSTHSPAYMVWNPSTHKVVFSRDIVFDEQSRSAGNISEWGNQHHDTVVSPELCVELTAGSGKPDLEKDIECENLQTGKDPINPCEMQQQHRRYPSRN